MIPGIVGLTQVTKGGDGDLLIETNLGRRAEGPHGAHSQILVAAGVGVHRGRLEVEQRGRVQHAACEQRLVHVHVVGRVAC